LFSGQQIERLVIAAFREVSLRSCMEEFATLAEHSNYEMVVE